MKLQLENFIIIILSLSPPPQVRGLRLLAGDPRRQVLFRRSLSSGHHRAAEVQGGSAQREGRIPDGRYRVPGGRHGEWGKRSGPQGGGF